MQIRFAAAVACLTTAVGVGASQAQAPAPAPVPAPAPPAYSPSAPASNAAVGTVRRQDRRQFMYEQQQRNEAEDALRSRAQAPPAARSSTRRAPR